MKQSILSGYYGACSEPRSPNEPFKYTINPKVVIGSSTPELIEEYKAKAKKSYPGLTNQFADFVAFDDSFIEDTLKAGLLLFGGYSGALRFCDDRTQIALTAISINAISQEYAEEFVAKKNLSLYWETDGFTNRMVKILMVEQGLIDRWRSLNS